MRRAALLCALPLLVASAAEDENPQACESQAGICVKDCEDEKFLGFFGSADYDRCRLKCDQEIDACTALDMDRDEFEVIRARGDVERRASPVPEPSGRTETDGAPPAGDDG